ncbi:asparagine synthase-related protein [Streptomyces sp. NPDC046215]|uniref:asparagine synthase-related protein n=1 Tax=Streptomyces TaxID=1883 RepID=UPI0031D7303F
MTRSGHATFDAIARQRWGIGVHAPFLDTPVVDARLSILGYLRLQPGLYKPLAQAAFAGPVPDFVLQRQTKTECTSSLYAGFAANASTLRAVIGGLRVSPARALLV